MTTIGLKHLATTIKFSSEHPIIKILGGGRQEHLI
jgi:hypothetical protein